MSISQCLSCGNAHEHGTSCFNFRFRTPVDHPAHYGGDTTYEAIKVIEAWGADFCIGNALKYLCRAGKKRSADADTKTDLEKAIWYIQRRIAQLDNANAVQDQPEKTAEGSAKPMTIPEELARLRSEQQIAAEAFRGPETDWYHKDGAWQGITDLLAEECLILIEHGEGA